MGGLSHEDVAARFLQSEAVNFGALGKFVADFGPELLLHDSGWHGVNFGRFNILACMLPAFDAARLVGNVRIASQVAAAIEGSVPEG
jgi:hypothetical protein